MPAWHRAQGRTRVRKSWEHWGRGRGLSQRSNALRVRNAASEPRSTFPVEYRRADFGVDDPFTRRKCYVELGPMSRLTCTRCHLLPCFPPSPSPLHMS
eukprot:169060-Chlamydomonas_euryale.AAC.2